MPLTAQQADITNKLEPGQAIISLATRYPFPLHVAFPLVQPFYVTDGDIDTSNSQDLRLQALLQKVVPAHEKPKEKKSERVPDDVRKFLWETYKGQYKKSKTEIYDSSGLKLGGTAKRICDYCEKNGLIRIIKLKLGKGSPQYPVLTSKGYEILGLEEVRFFGKGAGDEHIVCQNLLQDHLAALKPTIELNRGGKFIDIAIETNETLIAIEVEMTSANIENNVHADFEKANADFLVIACKDSKILKSANDIISQLPTTVQTKTQAFLLSELLTKKPDEFIRSIIERR